MCFADAEALVEAGCTDHRRCFDGSFVGSDAIPGTCYNRMCTSPDRVGSFTVHYQLLPDYFGPETMKRHGDHFMME